jgi:hypothetical protein
MHPLRQLRLGQVALDLEHGQQPLVEWVQTSAGHGGSFIPVT